MTRRVAVRRRSHLDRRLPHRVLVCAGPAARGDTGIEKPCAGRPAGRRGGRDRVGACRDASRTRGRPPKRWPSRTRDTPLRRGSSTPRTCDSTSPTRTSARCCWRARWRMDSKWHNACTSRVPRCRGQPTCSAPRSPVGRRSSRAVLTRRVPCWERRRPRCRRRGMPSAGDTGITSPTPPRWRCGVRPTRRPRCSPRSTTVRRPFRMLDYERSLARAWLAAGQGALTEAITTMLAAAETAAAKGQFAAEVVCLQTAVQFGDHSGASRLSELESMVEGPRAKLAARFATALSNSDGPELSAISKNSSSWAISSRRWMPPPTPALAFRHGRSAGISSGLFDARGSAGGTMRRHQHAGAARGQRTAAADRA